ncbi:MAG: hypothetical protein KJ571_16600, partial [Bacteroidetes bacterium]|nr:hypothetical protein [Bacteroidota bacterium]
MIFKIFPLVIRFVFNTIVFSFLIIGCGDDNNDLVELKDKKIMVDAIISVDSSMAKINTSDLQTKKQFNEVSVELAKKKRCLSCHEGIEKINQKMDLAWKSKKISASGVEKCEICHFGNPTGHTKELAHKDMIVNSADFRFIDKTCGRCHSKDGNLMTVVAANGQTDHVTRMLKGLMATSAGELSGSRYLWGEQMKKGAIYGIRAVVDKDGDIPSEKGALRELKEAPPSSFSDVDNMNRNFCIRCHLWTEGAKSPGNMRSSGCSACHVVYSDNGLSQSGDPTIDKNEKSRALKHQITV